MTNKFSIQLPRCLGSLKLSSLMLVVLLQRTPVLRLFACAESVWISSSYGQVLKASAVLVAALGAVDTLAGATTFTANPESPAEATVGTPFGSAFAITGARHDAGSYVIIGLPPGLSVPGASNIGGSLTLNAPSGVITGTPTQAGDFLVGITAFEFANHTGDSIANTYAISVELASSVESDPVITAQPMGLTVSAGQQSSFSVTVTGSPAPTFQWRKGGVNISGATSATYVIPVTASADAATYSVVATNALGSATSAGAVLTVNNVSGAPLFTTQPQDKAVIPGGSVAFIASASGTPAPTYQWRKNNVVINSATGNIYTVSSAGLTDVASYTVVATNSVGSVISNSATLVLNRAHSDFNGDGKSDVLLSNTTTGDRVIWLMNGSTVSTNAFAGSVSVDWVMSATGDFNGDGKNDLFWTNTTTGDRAIWLMNGSSATGGGYLGSIPLAWVVNGTGDFNGDGKADILWTNTLTGERSMWFMNGSVTSGGASLGVVSVKWNVAGVGDFNGDGKSDIFLSNVQTGDRVVWLMNGSTISTNAFAGTVPPHWNISGTGDFNGDGKTDLFWTNTETGDRAVWLMNGGISTGGGYLGSVPVAWVVHRTGDFNGDGKADVLWTNTITGERSMWFMNGSVAAAGATLGLVPLDWVIAN